MTTEADEPPTNEPLWEHPDLGVMTVSGDSHPLTPLFLFAVVFGTPAVLFVLSIILR